MICEIFLMLGAPYKNCIAEALSSSYISKKPNSSGLNIENSTLNIESAAQSEASIYTTSFPISRVTQEFFTAFINISYASYNENTSSMYYHTYHSETGQYGTSSHSSVHGVAIQMISRRFQLRYSSKTSELSGIDITGCYPPFLDNYPNNESWIAIVKRGNCTFNDKIRNALDLNASGVLVYDNEYGKPLRSMKGMRKY